MTPTVLPWYSPLAFEANGRSTSSVTGRASMSARMASFGPGLPPLRMPTTPVCAMPVLHLVTELLQLCGDELCRARFAIAQFGMFVKIAAHRSDVLETRIDQRLHRRLASHGRKAEACERGTEGQANESKLRAHGGSPAEEVAVAQSTYAFDGLVADPPDSPTGFSRDARDRDSPRSASRSGAIRCARTWRDGAGHRRGRRSARQRTARA